MCDRSGVAPDLDGYSIRPVRDDETAARVEVHRAAWKPSSIPYEDGRPIDPDAESSFTPAGCEIEPLGVAPEHRRRGLAVALCLEVAHLVASRGGTHVFINAQPTPGYVAPSAAYLSAGFELIERATTYAALRPAGDGI